MAGADGVAVARPLSPPARERRRGQVAWLLLPSALLFTLFFGLPFGVMVVISVLTGNPLLDDEVSFTTEHYARIVQDTYHLEVIWTTIRVGLWTTVFALLVGYPLAHWMARMRSRLGSVLLLMAVLTPLLTGIVVRTYAWITLLADNGVINASLRKLGLIDGPLPLMYNELGTVIALVHIFVPFMVLTLTGVIGRIDENLEHAARNLGASRLQAFREVTLPLSLPGILAGSLLVFALAISSYVTPILMGGFQVMTLPILIYQQISSTFNVGFAAALGFVLLAVSLVLVVFYNQALDRLAGRQDLL